MIFWMYEENQYVVIQEEHRVYKIFNTTCKKVIDEICSLHGSTYNGNRDAICRCLQITKQVPILVSKELNLILFPITNGNKGVYWIHYTFLMQVKKWDEAHTILEFSPVCMMKVETSYRTIHRQLQRCKIYLKILSTFDLQEYLDSTFQTLGHVYET